MRKVILSFVCAAALLSSCEKIVFKNPSDTPVVTPSDTTPPTITLTNPANNATGIALNFPLAITFSEAMDPATINATNITLKQGTTAVAAAVTYSGTTATLTPTAALSANKAYTATVSTAVKDVAGNALAAAFSVNFTTGATADVTPPTVSSTDPLNNATGVSLSKAVVVTFSEAMDPATLTSSTFTLKQGTTAVAGTVSYASNKATFTPTGVLTSNKVYTATITTGAKDLAGNAIAAAYNFSFTTTSAADVTPPTVVSTDPANNATTIAVNKVIGITFSKSMDPTTITTSTFTLKQGSTSVAGAVASSGSGATFTPTALLTANTVYTATITTGAKDASGNALTTATTWSFTTAAPTLSFAGDVVPVLTMCNNCHTHGWTVSSNPSTFYTNLVNKGYVKPSSYTTSIIYTKLMSGHPGSGNISTANTDKIINWMKAGSLNN